MFNIVDIGIPHHTQRVGAIIHREKIQNMEGGWFLGKPLPSAFADLVDGCQIRKRTPGVIIDSENGGIRNFGGGTIGSGRGSSARQIGYGGP